MYVEILLCRTVLHDIDNTYFIALKHIQSAITKVADEYTDQVTYGSLWADGVVWNRSRS